MTREERANHCRRIAQSGGYATLQKHGVAHLRAIGTAGAKVTIEKYGVGYFNGLMDYKGWHGRRLDSLITDLAYGQLLMELGA